MQTYKEYQPTGFDPKGLRLPDQQNWLVLPVIQTRDSEAPELSNFATALEMLGGESDTVEVCRFGHWGPGWFEIILVNPDSPQFAIAEQIESSLANYPVLDDEDFSRREYEARCESIEDNLPNCLLGSCLCHLSNEQVPIGDIYSVLSDCALEGSYVNEQAIEKACFDLGLLCPIELIDEQVFSDKEIADYILKFFKDELPDIIAHCEEVAGKHDDEFKYLQRLKDADNAIVPENQLGLFA